MSVIDQEIVYTVHLPAWELVFHSPGLHELENCNVDLD